MSHGFELAVLSPSLDNKHGTEVCILRQIEAFASVYGWKIHLFSQHVEDIDWCLPEQMRMKSGGCIAWHRVHGIRGPHLIKFLWWLLANRVSRARRLGNRLLLYSPGINCFDADAIVVHVVFHELSESLKGRLYLRHLPIASWPKAIHRRIYYWFARWLERRVYRNRAIRLAAVSKLVASQLQRHFGRDDTVVIPNGVDTTYFSPQACLGRRADARLQLKLEDSDFALLLVGNDWKLKGLDQMLLVIRELTGAPVRLLVVGNDEPTLYRNVVRDLKLNDSVKFYHATKDVLSFYAAADVYVAPSLGEAFGLPILEAMACGLPVIASVMAGASEAIIDGQNGYLLKDPNDVAAMAELVRRLLRDRTVAARLGLAAATSVQTGWSWQRNFEATRDFLQTVRLRSSRFDEM